MREAPFGLRRHCLDGIDDQVQDRLLLRNRIIFGSAEIAAIPANLSDAAC